MCTHHVYFILSCILINTHLFDPFLFTLLDNKGVGVAHHSNQHVEQKDWDHDHENNEHRGRDCRICGFRKICILLKSTLISIKIG